MHLNIHLIGVVEVIYHIAHMSHFVSVDKYRACIYNFSNVAELYIILFTGAENVYSFEKVNQQIDYQNGNYAKHAYP